MTPEQIKTLKVLAEKTKVNGYDDEEPWYLIEDLQNGYGVQRDDYEYIAAASPDVVLAILAENEKLRYALARVCAKYVGDSNLVMDCARAALGEK